MIIAIFSFLINRIYSYFNPSSEPVFDVDKQSQWQLTQDLLQDGLRVLIAEEGLFRGGAVTCIRPPDIYGILVDGERGSRPRIFSTEELLQEAVNITN